MQSARITAMIIKKSQATKKTVGPMIINEYKINTEFSAAFVEINGEHGTLKCLNEDRIYFIVEGEGRFIINDEETSITAQDLVFIPKNTPYDLIGSFKYLLICSPEFNSEDDVFLKGI